MIKKRIYAITALMFAVAGVAGAADTEYVEKAGNFSLAIPSNWTIITVKGLKYKILQGPFENGLAPNINVADKKFAGTFDEYIANLKEGLDRIYGENIEYILQSPFATSKGLTGEVIVITTYQKEILIQQSFFSFPAGKGKYITITCSNRAADYEQYIPLFHTTLKTFEWLK